ncbi:hypothetical protein [Streptomyces sp. NPDC048445]|uniref:hypothetical protein n=1 Tax=Streptomyces sp. NPDC048445 TaxID=3365553 RepID=UPI003716D25D
MIRFENSGPEYALNALLVVVMLVGVWLLVTVVRYVRADRGTRVSMRQAVRVRWGWVRLARMAGLTVTDKTPGLLAQITAQKDGPTPAPRVLTPRIKVKPDPFGVIVQARTLPKVGLEEYQKSARFLAVHAGVRPAGRPRQGGDPGRALRPADHADHAPAHRPPAGGPDALGAGH